MLPLIALLALFQPALAFRQTHPLIQFTEAHGCSPSVVHFVVPGLHADDFAAFPPNSAGLKLAYGNAQVEKRSYRAYLSPTESLASLLRPLGCSDASHDFILLEGLDKESKVSDRRAAISLIDAQINDNILRSPMDALFTVSSHPALHKQALRKRQMLEPNLDELVDALQQYTDGVENNQAEDSGASRDDWAGIDFGDANAENSEEIAENQQMEQPDEDLEVSDWQEGQFREEFDGIPTATSVAENAASTVMVLQQSSKAANSSNPLPSNAAFIAKYAIVTPNLIFATLLFLLVLFPAGIITINALSSIESPFGLETKMQGGSVSNEKKDQ